MSANTPVIDAHAMLGRENHLELDADELLRRMDAAGIETAVARSMGAELVVDNRAGNDRLLAAGPRIRALATANPWYGAAARQELERCRDRGAVGLFLHPSRQGFMPIEPIVPPLLDLAAEWRWPVVFHTGTYVYSDILAVAEVARRYPETSFIAGFGGFTDMWFELPGVFGQVANLLLDASLIWGEAVEQIVAQHGAERVLFGGGEPRGRYAVALNTMERLQLIQRDRRLLMGENAKRVFHL